MIEFSTMPADAASGLGGLIMGASDTGQATGNLGSSDFKELVAKLMDEPASGEAKETDGSQAGQQVSDGQGEKANKTSEEAAGAIAQMELLLGSVGVVQGMPEAIPTSNTADTAPMLQGVSSQPPILQGTTPQQSSEAVVTPAANGVVTSNNSSASATPATTLTDKTQVLSAAAQSTSDQQNNQTVLQGQGVSKEIIPQESSQTKLDITSSAQTTDTGEMTTISTPNTTVENKNQQVIMPSEQSVTPVATEVVTEVIAASQTQAQPDSSSVTESSAVSTAVKGENLGIRQASGAKATAKPANPTSVTDAEVAVQPVAQGRNVVKIDATDDEVALTQADDTTEQKKGTVESSKPENSVFQQVIDAQHPETPPAEAAAAVSAPMAPERVVSAKIIHQVVKSAKLQSLENGTGMVIRLDPPHLGNLQVNVTVSNGSVSASIQTSNETTSQLLQADMANLKQALSDAGIRVDSINVSVSTNLNQNWQPPSGGQNAPGKQPNYAAARHAFGYTGSDTSVESTRSARSSGSGRFDYLA